VRDRIGPGSFSVSIAMTASFFQLLALALGLLTVGEQNIQECTTHGTLESRVLVQKQSHRSNLAPLQNGSALAHLIEWREEVVAEPSTRFQENGSSSASGALGFIAISYETAIKPQLKSILQMLCLPLCICVIMICVSTMIDFMEENAVYFSSSLEGRVNSSFCSSNNVLDTIKKQQNQQGAPLCPELVSPMKNECIIVVPSLAEIPAGQSTYDTNIMSKMGSPIVRITVARVVKLAHQEDTGRAFKSLLGSSGTQVFERIEMVSWKKQKLLCYCELQAAEASASSSGSRSSRTSSAQQLRGGSEDSDSDRSTSSRQFECSIYRHTGELFAVLEEDIEPSPVGQQVFILSSANGSGWRLRIQGNVAQRSLTVMDSSGKQIVAVEPSGNLKFTTRDPTAKYFRLRAQPKVDAGVVLGALLAIDRLPGSHRV